ncbi:hypothetical protein [Methyloglobulus sp.]|uniref:nSTAND1 domain-containing NTPase n=1 Tax=Methyloglobulus sp. TaxID=2518622 RepID=UPI0032B70EA6
MNFIGHLLAATDDPKKQVLVVVTLRSDFQDKLLAKHSQLVNSIQTQQALLAPMQAHGLRTIIEEPAKKVGLEFEDGLVEKLIQETTDAQGFLPLVEYTLQQLGNAAHQDNHNLMRWDNFHKLGGVAGVLAKQAEQVYNKLEKSEQHIARRVLLKLITPRTVAEEAENTARTIKALDLWQNQEIDKLIEKVITVFVKGRLLIAARDGNTGDMLLSFPHEALIQHWPRLLSWIKEDSKDLLIGHRIKEAANQWINNNKGEGYLWGTNNLPRHNPGDNGMNMS